MSNHDHIIKEIKTLVFPFLSEEEREEVFNNPYLKEILEVLK